VICGVGRFDVGEIEHVDVLRGEPALVGFGVGIDRAQPRIAAPNPVGEGEGLIVPRREERESRMRIAHVRKLALESVDVHVRCSQHHIVYFR